jgi:hypothetical protein
MRTLSLHQRTEQDEDFLSLLHRQQVTHLTRVLRVPRLLDEVRPEYLIEEGLVHLISDGAVILAVVLHQDLVYLEFLLQI